MARSMGLVGIGVFMALAWAFSRDRRAIHWRTVAWALALQWLLGLIVLKARLLAGALGWIPFPAGAGWAWSSPSWCCPPSSSSPASSPSSTTWGSCSG